MKQSLIQIKRAIRESYLEAERISFSKLPNTPFKLVKDWDHDPTVIWKGKIQTPNLKRAYDIEIHYGGNYPYCHPKVFPTDKHIRNNRHQNPSPLGASSPGDICIFQEGLSDWVVGIDCNEIIHRATKWFEKYEDGTLDLEPAPPEIERYYSGENKLNNPQVFLAETLINFGDDKYGDFIWLPTDSGKFSFIATTSKLNSESVVEELFRLLKIILPDEAPNKDKLEIGRWYLIENEPFESLPKNSSELLELIAKNNRSISLKSIVLEFSYNHPPFIALCYPTQFDNVHWLVYQFLFGAPQKSKGVIPGFRKMSQYKALLRHNRNEKLMLLPVHHLSRDVIFRRASYIPIKRLTKSSILLLGCGTLGSRVADLLTKSGIGALKVIDCDLLKVGNVARHVLGLDYVGSSKAEGLKKYLLKHNPFLNIDSFYGNVLDDNSFAWLGKAIEDSDVIISCIGDDAVENWINQVSMTNNKPLVFCRMYAQATIGEILFAKPQKLCFSCMSGFLDSKDHTIPRIPKLKFGDMVRFDDADCGATYIPGSAVDIDLVALYSSTVVTNYLLTNHTQDSYWLIRGRPFELDNDWNVDARLIPPYTLLKFTPTPRFDCPICGYKYKRN